MTIPSDRSTWTTGDLNALADAVGVSHNADGTLTAAAVQSALGGYIAPVPRLLAQLENARFEPTTTLSTDAPTISFGTSATLTARTVSGNSGNIRVVGSGRAWDNVNDRQPVAFSSGIDFYFNGLACEIAILPNLSGALPIQIWVDGKPVTADTDSTSVSSVTPVPTYVKLTWGAAKRRHVEFFWDGSGGSIYYVGCAIGDIVTPGPPKALVASVGDSFFSTATGVFNNLQASDFLACRKLGVDSVSPSYGGSGWTVGGSLNVKFGDASRITDIQGVGTPDLLFFQGSVNDDGQAGIQAAVTAALAAYTAAFPLTPIIVFGPQPTDATNTISANRSANIAAVKAAALAATNVIGFHDMVGTAASVPAAYSAQTYAHGTLVTFRGSVWQMLNNGVSVNPGSPQSTRRWKLVTRGGLFGTGKVGSTASDGPRDTQLYSDGVHPTSGQQQINAEEIVCDIVADLRNWAAGGSIRVT